MLLGHAHGEPVLLVRRGEELFAIGAICTHYGGPLGEGLLVDDTVRCPWHHACFSLRTGEALRAPALNPISCWRSTAGRQGFRSRKAGARCQPDIRLAQRRARRDRSLSWVAARRATLRQKRFVMRVTAGRITMLSADESLPCDRPNLSKGYLAGTAPEEWNLLRSASSITSTTST